LEVIFSTEVLGLIGSVLGGISLLGTIAFHFYKKTARLSVKSKTETQSVELLLTNKSDFKIEIEYIRLLKKEPLFQGYTYDENTYFHLVETEKHGFQTNQNDKLNLVVSPEDPVHKVIIPFDRIIELYHYFLPYNYSENHIVGVLEKAIKMPTCFIGIYLKNGKMLTVKINEPFYSFYRFKAGSYYEYDISVLKGERKVKNCFENLEEYTNYKNSLLDSFVVAKGNEYRLRQ
jgi:hypothetical protein